MLKRALRNLLFGLSLALALGTAGSHAQESAAPEYQVKAAYLYNFAKFVEWPPRALSSAGSPLVIGIMGKDPFGQNLERVLAGKTAHDRPLAIKRSDNLSDLAGAHVLFISVSEKADLAAILDRLKNAPVLTVSEAEEFNQLGGMIRFVLKDTFVRFEINPKAAERSGLKISSKVLKLAENLR